MHQQLQAATAAGAMPPVTNAAASAEAASAAESEVQTTAEEAAGPLVLATVNLDASDGRHHHPNLFSPPSPSTCFAPGPPSSSPTSFPHPACIHFPPSQPLPPPPPLTCFTPVVSGSTCCWVSCCLRGDNTDCTFVAHLGCQQILCRLIQEIAIVQGWLLPRQKESL